MGNRSVELVDVGDVALSDVEDVRCISRLFILNPPSWTRAHCLSSGTGVRAGCELVRGNGHMHGRHLLVLQRTHTSHIILCNRVQLSLTCYRRIFFSLPPSCETTNFGGSNRASCHHLALGGWRLARLSGDHYCTLVTDSTYET